MAAATHPTLAWSSANPTPSTPPSASTRLHTGQALNLAKLRKALGLSGAGPEAGGVSIGVSGVGVPASVALPYGSFERCLREEPRNAAAAAEVARLTAAAAAAAAGGEAGGCSPMEVEGSPHTAASRGASFARNVGLAQ